MNAMSTTYIGYIARDFVVIEEMADYHHNYVGYTGRENKNEKNRSLTFSIVVLLIQKL